MKIKGLKTEKRITPEGLEMKFIYKCVIDTFTCVDFSDIFELEQKTKRDINEMNEKKEDIVEFKMYNYPDGTEIGTKVSDLRVKAHNLWIRLHDKKENINIMKKEIELFLLEVYYCRK